MSVEAQHWAMSVKVGDATRKLVLYGMANHAHKNGRNSWATYATLAEYAECSVRTVQRHVNKLLAGGYIRRGDQAQVAHLRADQRPVVYDLAMNETTRQTWATEAAANPTDTTERPVNLSPRNTSDDPSTCHPVERGRPDTRDTPSRPDDLTKTRKRPDTAVSDRTKTKPTTYPPTPHQWGATPPTQPDPANRPCQRHPQPTPGCRSCGTTPRQQALETQRRAAAERRAADRAAITATRAAKANTPPPDPAVIADLRNKIRAAS